MHVVVASDHAGYLLKEELKKFIAEQLGHTIEDAGAYILESGDDYPDFVAKAAEKISANAGWRAVILGGSGAGEAIVANRYPNVRAVVYYGGNEKIITLSREHNDANILSLGSRFLEADDAKHAVRLWLETPFGADERHARRIAKIEMIELPRGG